ncbi:MAG: hypothetical protein WDN00_05910 [Limisphaerales bacterium]
MNTEMFQAHGKVFWRGSGVVGEKKKGRTDFDQGLDKFHGPGNQLVFPVNDPVHVNQVSCFHW